MTAANTNEWKTVKEPSGISYMVKSADDTLAVAGTFHRSMANELAYRLNSGKPIPLTVLALKYGRS